MNLTSILSNFETAEKEQSSRQETRYITDQLSLFNLSGNVRYDYTESRNFKSRSNNLYAQLSQNMQPFRNRDISDTAGRKKSSGRFLRKFLNEPATPWGENNRLVRGPCETTVNRFRRLSEAREERGEARVLAVGGGGMPRSKRRAPSSTNHHHHHHTSTDMSPSANDDNVPRHPSKRLRHTLGTRRYTKSEDVSSASSFSQKRCIAWFREYTIPDDPDTLGPEGMEKFCEDIGVEPENVVMLVLAYRMNARQMGFFTLSEWLKGLSELQCDSVNKVQQKLEYLRNLLNDSHTFKGIYRYAYDFARDKDQRSMDMETARVMLQLLLGKHWPLFSQFAQFLDQSKYKVINKDQWCNILEFSRTINHDLSNYDLDGAWPVMLDEFVEWLKLQRGEGTSSTEVRGS